MSQGEIIIYTIRLFYMMPVVLRCLLHIRGSQIIPYDLESSIVIDPSKIYIFVQTIPQRLIGRKNIILFNIEHLSREDYRSYILRIIPQHLVIDFSYENILYLDKYYHFKSDQHLFLPFPWCPKIIYPYINKEYEFVFFGNPTTPKRKKILEAINQKYSIHYITTNYNFETLALEEILKGKILINIHHNEKQNMTELLRIYPVIYNKMLVISEESCDMSITHTFPLSRFIIFSSYSHLVETALSVRENYDSYYQKIYASFDPQEIKSLTHTYLDQIEKRIGITGK